MNIESIKDQFPIFKRLINEKPLVFLDSAASAQKPIAVIEAMDDVMSNHYANINRGVYTLSEEATQLVEDSRVKVQKFIGAASVDEIIFTRNATESINLVMYSWARKNLKRGDVVVTTEMEHHSNIVPWQMLRDEIGIELRWMTVNDEGYLDWKNVDSDRVKLVCVTHVSNVLGTINPVKEIAAWSHSIGAKILVDGAQGIVNVPVDVVEIDADWYVFSGHKLYGPSGVGVLFGKMDVLNAMDPFLGGGDMVLEVHKNESSYKKVPHKFEAGTPAIVEIIGLGAAIDFVTAVGMITLRNHSEALLQYSLTQLAKIDGLTLYGPMDSTHKGGVIAFTLKGIHPHDIATILDEEGIAIRSGHHCAQPLCDRFNQPAMARISFGVYTTNDDIDALIIVIQKVQDIFK
ncbi:MAG: cysteine desulfurase [bacterium]|nr:cysteine desulfurase [bacterium]